MFQIGVTIRPGLVPYLKELRDAGMTLARLNGSHGTKDWHQQVIQKIRNDIPEVLILLDLPGRKIRLNIDTNMTVKAGVSVVLPLPNFIPDRTEILLDDGQLTGQVLGHVDEGLLEISFHNNGNLRPHMGVNVPTVPLQGPLLTARDIDFIDLAQQEKVDFLGLSFIESSALIHHIRQHCAIPCIAKIETAIALKNLEDICTHADGVMVARGDLSVEGGLYHIIAYQKHILKTAQNYNILPMVGTGFMTLYPPQQSTIADIYNAACDGCEWFITSGDVVESQDSIEMVKTLNAILQSILLHKE